MIGWSHIVIFTQFAHCAGDRNARIIVIWIDRKTNVPTYISHKLHFHLNRLNVDVCFIYAADEKVDGLLEAELSGKYDRKHEICLLW